MGIDTHMIAGVRACLTFTPDRSSPAIQTTPHYAEALAHLLLQVPQADQRGSTASGRAGPTGGRSSVPRVPLPRPSKASWNSGEVLAQGRADAPRADA